MKKMFILMLILLLCGCTNTESPKTAEYADVLDTYCSLSVYGLNDDEFNDVKESVHEELKRYDRLFSIYDDYDGINNIKTINDNAGKHTVDVDMDIIRLLEAGKEYYGKTNGTVNIAMGSVLSLWHDCRQQAEDGSPKLPDMYSLKAAAGHTDINSIVIDQQNSTVYISDEKTKIDVGAVAKGYIAEELKSYLKQKGVCNALINLGGNVVTMGMPPTQDKWVIGVQNPDMSDEFADTIYMGEGAAVTSGDYQRYYIVDGKRYCHIIDGKTLYPAERFRGVTVIAENSAFADAMSTALFIMPIDDGKELAKENGFKAVWVMKDGSVEKTE